MRNIGLNVFMLDISRRDTIYNKNNNKVEYSSNIQYIIGFIYKDCNSIYMFFSLNVC